MALKAFPFPEWTPDLADTGTLTIARNVIPLANGYAPVKAFAAITPALASKFLGGAAFVGSDGTASLLAGTATDLYKFSGSAWTSLIGTRTATRWRFCQFGDNTICADSGKLISYGLLTGTAAEIASAPTNCIDVARVRDFVMALRDDDEVEWSEFNDSSTWGTGVNQADSQPLLGGGKGVALVGGEYGVVLQKNSIQRITYTGQPGIIFQFDEISPEIGCMTQGSVANVGRLIFFLSERGFEMCDGQTVTSISNEKFSRWFFSLYSRAEIDGMSAAIDPREHLVMWAMPGAPSRIIAYNWTLKRGAVIEAGVSAIFTGFTSSTDLDSLDTDYPDLDAMTISLDDPSFSGGNPLLLAVNDSFEAGSLSGSNLEAQLQLDKIEPTPAKRSRIRLVRPVTDATTASAKLNSRMRAGDEEFYSVTGSMRGSGKMPLRANGRYINALLTIPAGERWSYVQGLEIEFEAGDAR